jgi:ubiquinone/menaquinone biosynthesis C-methylase UbiE
MADESMVRNLHAQARAICPQEMPLFKRYRLPANPQILDAGCGIGELASRLAELFSRIAVEPKSIFGLLTVGSPCSYSLEEVHAHKSREIYWFLR